MSGVEGQDLAGTDPLDLQLPRAVVSRRMPTPQSTAPATRLIDTKSLLQVTLYRGDKASFLWLQCEQSANYFTWRTQENWRQHESGFPKIPIVQWRSGAFRSGVHTGSVALQRWSVCSCEIRRRRKRLSSVASPLESTNSSKCDKPFESVTGTNIHVTRLTHQSSTLEQKCWGARDTNGWTGKWWNPKGSLHEHKMNHRICDSRWCWINPVWAQLKGLPRK